MSVTKKNTTRKRAKKTSPTMVLVTKTFHSVDEAIFPDKVKKVKEMLLNSDFRPNK
jgi:hypothetical protein